MNSTFSLTIVLTCDPPGGASFHINTVDKGPQGDATYQQEGHDGPVSLHCLIREIPSYQALQYLGIGLKHRPLTRTKIGSHSSNV